MQYEDQSYKNLRMYAAGGLSKPSSDIVTSKKISVIDNFKRSLKVEAHIIGASHWVKVFLKGECVFSEVFACCDVEDVTSKNIFAKRIGSEDYIVLEGDLGPVNYGTEVYYYNQLWPGGAEAFVKSQKSIFPDKGELSSHFIFPSNDDSPGAGTGIQVSIKKNDSIYISSIHEYKEENVSVLSRSKVRVK